MSGSRTYPSVEVFNSYVIKNPKGFLKVEADLMECMRDWSFTPISILHRNRVAEQLRMIESIEDRLVAEHAFEAIFNILVNDGFPNEENWRFEDFDQYLNVDGRSLW